MQILKHHPQMTESEIQGLQPELVLYGAVCTQCVLSCVPPFATPWTVAHQAPLPMEFSRQAYWSGLPFPPPGDLPDPGIEPRSPALQADSLLLSH